MSSPTFKGKGMTPIIRAHKFCYWCNGGNPASCVSPACLLFLVRMGKTLPGTKGSTLQVIRAFCLGCAGSPEAVRTCTAYKPFSEVQPECPLWPYRDGKRHVSAEYRKQRREQAKMQLAESGPGALFAPQKPLNEKKRG